MPVFGYAVRPHRIASQFRQAARRLLLGPSSKDSEQRNIWYLCVEVAWAGLLGAAASFNTAFVVRLGGSNALVGWLTSAPALVAALVLIPSARILERQADRSPWIWGSLAISRVVYAVIAVLPWLVHRHQAEAVVALLILSTIPGTFFNAAWTPLLADTIPQRERTRVFTQRMVIYSAVVAVLTLVAGKWLDVAQQRGWTPFPLNYQSVYLAGLIGAILSTACVRAIRPPRSASHPSPQSVPGKPLLTELRSMLSTQREYRALLINTFILDAGAWLAAPLYTILFVRELGASDAWIGLNSTLANAAVIIGYLLWRRALRHLGYLRGLLISAPLAACYAFLVALCPHLTLILLWGVLINIINPGLSLSHTNILLQICPETRRATYLAAFSTVMNLGAFLLPMVGVALTAVLDIRAVLLLAGSLRLLGALLFHANKVHVPRVEIA